MGILSQGALTFSHPLIHSMHSTILYANEFQAELLAISTDNSRGKKQTKFVSEKSSCIPAVIHSALDRFCLSLRYNQHVSSEFEV